MVPSGSPVAGLLRAPLWEVNACCYVTLINDTGAASDGRRTSAGAASDLHGLLAAGEPLMRRKPVRASPLRSAAFGRRNFPAGGLDAWPERPDLTLRARQKVGVQEGCASTFGECTRRKPPLVVPITCTASRFPCTSAWQDRCPRIERVPQLVWEAC